MVDNGGGKRKSNDGLFFTYSYTHYRFDRFAWRRPLLRISYYVLVVPPKPRPRFVPPFRCPVEPLVHSPERVEAARVGGVGMIDNAVGECERAHARRLASVGGGVGASHGREIARRKRLSPILTAL
jgi:hypothetical protein